MKAVPFFPNTDNMHCYESSFRMILKYFLPDQDFSVEQLELMSEKRPGLSTWPHHMLLKLKGLGLTSTMIEGFDVQTFVNEGGNYLKREFGEETAAWQIRNSDIPFEQKTYHEYVNKLGYVHRVPTLKDVIEYLDKGALIDCLINSRKINGLDGYVGHSVVVFKVDNSFVYLHDPGLPPLENRKVSHAEFEAAWASPNAKAKSMIAVEYKGKL